MDFFPSVYLKPRELSKEAVDEIIPHIEECLDDSNDEDVDDEEVLKEGDEDKDTVENPTEEKIPAAQITEPTAAVTVQSELKRFLKHQESGLEATYRCIRCRGCPQCLKGAGQENISIRMEFEQELI